MTDPTEPPLLPDELVRYARFREKQHVELMELARKHPTLLPFDRDLHRRYVKRIVDDRLGFADEHLKAADDLLGLAAGPLPTARGDFLLRAALGRAYYAVHHALRSLHLTFRRWDTDTHDGTISGTNSLLDTHPNLRSLLDPRRDLLRLVGRLMDERHVADYHMYGREELGKPETDFAVAAPQAVLFAQYLLPLVAQAIEKHRRNEL